MRGSSQCREAVTTSGLISTSSVVYILEALIELAVAQFHSLSLYRSLPPLISWGYGRDLMIRFTAQELRRKRLFHCLPADCFMTRPVDANPVSYLQTQSNMAQLS